MNTKNKQQAIYSSLNLYLFKLSRLIAGADDVDFNGDGIDDLSIGTPHVDYEWCLTFDFEDLEGIAVHGYNFIS